MSFPGVELLEETSLRLRRIYRWEMRPVASSRRQKDLEGRGERGDRHLLEEPGASREVLEELGGMHH